MSSKACPTSGNLGGGGRVGRSIVGSGGRPGSSGRSGGFGNIGNGGRLRKMLIDGRSGRVMYGSGGNGRIRLDYTTLNFML